MNKILLIIVLFVAVFMIAVYVLKQRSNSDLKNKRYTVATITQKELKKNGAVYHFKFLVNNTNYKGTFHHNKTTFTSGARYYVAYSSLNPEQNFLEIQQPVPDTITTIPEQGWTQIPQ